MHGRRLDSEHWSGNCDWVVVGSKSRVPLFSHLSSSWWHAVSWYHSNILHIQEADQSGWHSELFACSLACSVFSHLEFFFKKQQKKALPPIEEIIERKVHVLSICYIMSPVVAKRSSFGRGTGTWYRYLWLNAQHPGLLRSTVPGKCMYRY